jgi:hypothetical protein
MGGLEIKRGWTGLTMLVDESEDADKSSGIDVRYYVSGVLFPPGTLTQTGGLWYWQASLDNVTYQDLYDVFNVKVTQTLTQARPIDVPAECFTGAPYVRLAAPGAEAADRTFSIVLKG